MLGKGRWKKKKETLNRILEWIGCGVKNVGPNYNLIIGSASRKGYSFCSHPSYSPASFTNVDLRYSKLYGTSLHVQHDDRNNRTVWDGVQGAEELHDVDSAD